MPVPVVLDTDHLSVLQWQEQPACRHLLARLDALPSDDIATTIVTIEATLLSRNLRDFRQVPGLRVEDWTT